jgi:cell shape-determining protein MreD
MNSKLLGFVFVFFLNLAIALGFYYDDRNANATDISSDLGNIIPVCMKLDNLDSFKNDLYLNDSKDVEYYTPFYIQSLRYLSKITNGDYIKALNILGFITHLIYGMSWFLLFYKLKKDYWLAIISSLLIRGVVWPPGGELLGISELWTIMPRTVFLALVPLPFIAYVYLKKHKIIISGFLLGFILNFHPLSGIGIIVAYFSIFVLYNYYQKTLRTKIFVKNLTVLILSCFIGLLPFLITYLTAVKTNFNIAPNTYELALSGRIDSMFMNPLEFIAKWNRPPLIFFGAVFLIYYFFDASYKKINFKMLFFTALIVFVSANSFAYFEGVINELFHKNIRMAFQLIRYQKFILVLFQIGFYLLLVELFTKYFANILFKMISFAGYTVVLIISTLPVFKNVPFVGDDITTEVLPKSFKIYNEVEDEKKKKLGLMLEYVKNNTEKNAVFYGSPLIRTAANRAVVLDGKGAGMLIEGNPEKFVKWYLDLKHYNALTINGKIAFLKSKKANYILDDSVWSGLIPKKKIGEYYLYRI